MDWIALFDKYGYPTLLLFALGLFFYKKVWPLVEKFILGILANMENQTKILETMSQWQAEQDKHTAQHLVDTENIVQMMRDGKK